jgi:hypothetical protein
VPIDHFGQELLLSRATVQASTFVVSVSRRMASSTMGWSGDAVALQVQVEAPHGRGCYVT